MFNFRNQCLESDVVLRYGNIIKPSHENTSKLEEVFIKPELENLSFSYEVDDDDNHYDDGGKCNDYYGPECTDIFDDIKSEIEVSLPKKKQRKKKTILKIKIKKSKKIESVRVFEETNAEENILGNDNLVSEKNVVDSENDEKVDDEEENVRNKIKQKECNVLHKAEPDEGKFLKK